MNSIEALKSAPVLNMPLPAAVNETVAHRIYTAASFLIAAQCEIGIGPDGRIGHLAAHLGDAVNALDNAVRAFAEATGVSLDSPDLGAFGYRLAMADRADG